MAAASLYDEPSLPSFKEYPTARPFLNSDLARDVTKPPLAFPESSSQAVLSALKGLQDKIRNLELDRSKAERNLKELAAETSLYKDLLTQTQKTPEKESVVNHHDVTPTAEAGNTSYRNGDLKTAGIEFQLKNADTRCRMLEKQLENMRKMVVVAEKERSDALERQVAMERERSKITAESRDTKAKLGKLENLQNRFNDLSARKKQTEEKVKELEEKLKFEEHQKKLLSNRAARYCSEAKAQAILLKDELPQRDNAPRKRTKSKKISEKKKSKLGSKKSQQCAPTSKHFSKDVQPHYHLNFADVPFITGTSTSPSHAVSTNMQKLLHDLKQHNPLYCNSHIVHGDKKRLDVDDADTDSDEEQDEIQSGSTKSKSKSRPTSSEKELSELMVALQDEFAKLTFEHQVLTQQVAETHDKDAAKDLHHELSALEQKMEIKGDQIVTVRRHRGRLEKARKLKARKKKNGSQMSQKPMSITSREKLHGGFAVQSATRSRPSIREHRLHLLRDVKLVHSALHRDDISWD